MSTEIITPSSASVQAIVKPCMPTTSTIPSELTKLSHWVLWKYEGTRNGKNAKVPYQVNGKRAKTDEPNTWSSFEGVHQASIQSPGRFDGIGFVFADSDPYVGIDLDDCLDQDGLPKGWARSIVEGFQNTYHEISPSGRGLKIWAKARLDGPGVRVSYHDGAIEIYDRGRFFTMTGRRLEGFATLSIEERQQDVAKLYKLVRAGSSSPCLKSKTSLPENVLTLRLVYGDGHAEEQGAPGAVVVRN
jgi:putative DNA primase/helicase